MKWVDLVCKEFGLLRVRVTPEGILNCILDLLTTLTHTS